MDNIGWVGSILLAFCGLPQMLDAIKKKSAKGLTWGFLLMWYVGELATFVYILPKADLPLLVNYGANILFLSVIIHYKRKEK